MLLVEYRSRVVLQVARNLPVGVLFSAAAEASLGEASLCLEATANLEAALSL